MSDEAETDPVVVQFTQGDACASSTRHHSPNAAAIDRPVSEQSQDAFLLTSAFEQPTRSPRPVTAIATDVSQEQIAPKSTAGLDMNPEDDTDLQYIACGDTSARESVDKTSLAAEHALANTTDSAVTSVNDNQHVSQLRTEPIPCHTNAEAVKHAEPEGAASIEVSDHSTVKKPFSATMQRKISLPSDLYPDSALNGDALPPKCKKKTRRGTLGHGRKRPQHINDVQVNNPVIPVQLPDQFPSAQELPSAKIWRTASNQTLGMQRPPQQQSTLIAAQHMPFKQMHPQQNQCMHTPFAAHASQSPPFQHRSATQRMWAAVPAHPMPFGHCQVGQQMAHRQETAVGQQQHGHMAGNFGQLRQDWPKPHGHMPCNRSAIRPAFPFMQHLAFQHRLQYQQQRPGYQYQQQHFRHQNQQQHQHQQQYQPKQQYQPQQQYPPKQQYQLMQPKEMYHPQEFQVPKRSSCLPSQRPAQKLVPGRHYKPLLKFAAHAGPRAAMKDSKPGMSQAEMSQEASDAFKAQMKDDHVLMLLRHKPSAVQQPEAKHCQVEGQHSSMQQHSCTPGLVGKAAPPLPPKQQPNADVVAQQSLSHRHSNLSAAQGPKCNISGTPFDMFRGLPSRRLVFRDMDNSQYADWLHRARGRQRLHRK